MRPLNPEDEETCVLLVFELQEEMLFQFSEFSLILGILFLCPTEKLPLYKLLIDLKFELVFLA